MTHKVFVGGKVHVRRTRCSTCIFRPHNLMSLEPGRVEAMIERCGSDKVIPCHQHLYEDAAVEPVCRGFYDLGNTPVLDLARAINIIKWVA